MKSYDIVQYVNNSFNNIYEHNGKKAELILNTLNCPFNSTLSMYDNPFILKHYGIILRIYWVS